MKFFDLLSRFYVFVKTNSWLFFILIIAVLLRGYGIYFDYPFGTNFIWDEIFSVVYIFDVLETKNIFIGTYQYPLLLPLLYLPGLFLRLIYLALTHGIYNLEKLKELLIVGGIDQVYIIVRWYSVAFGTATVYFLYKIYHLIFKNKASAYYAALVYSVSLAPVFIAHWGKTHSIMVFFIIVSLYTALKYETTKRDKYFYFCSLWAACAFSIHYIGASVAILPFYLYITNWRKINFKKLLSAFFIYLSVVGTFYGLNIPGVKGMLNNNLCYFQSSGTVGMSSVGFWERFYYIPFDSFNVEPVFITLFIFLLIYNFLSLIKNNLVRYIFVILGFNYLFTITIVAWPGVIRWQMTFITLAISLGGALLFELLQRKLLNRRLIYFIASLFLLPSLLITCKWLSLINNNTMLETSRWLEENVKNNEIVYSFDRYLETPLSYEAVKYHIEQNNHSSKKAEYVLNNKDKLDGFGVNLFYDYDNYRYQALGGTSTKYIIVSFWNLENGYALKKDAKRNLEEVEKYHRLKLVKTFYPTKNDTVPDVEWGDIDILNNPIRLQTLFKLKSSGPFFEIYEVIN